MVNEPQRLQQKFLREGGTITQERLSEVEKAFARKGDISFIPTGIFERGRITAKGRRRRQIIEEEKRTRRAEALLRSEKQFRESQRQKIISETAQEIRSIPVRISELRQSKFEQIFSERAKTIRIGKQQPIEEAVSQRVNIQVEKELAELEKSLGKTVSREIGKEKITVGLSKEQKQFFREEARRSITEARSTPFITPKVQGGRTIASRLKEAPLGKPLETKTSKLFVRPAIIPPEGREFTGTTITGEKARFGEAAPQIASTRINVEDIFRRSKLEALKQPQKGVLGRNLLERQADILKTGIKQGSKELIPAFTTGVTFQALKTVGTRIAPRVVIAANPIIDVILTSAFAFEKGRRIGAAPKGERFKTIQLEATKTPFEIGGFLLGTKALKSIITPLPTRTRSRLIIPKDGEEITVKTPLGEVRSIPQGARTDLGIELKGRTPKQIIEPLQNRFIRGQLSIIRDVNRITAQRESEIISTSKSLGQPFPQTRILTGKGGRGIVIGAESFEIETAPFTKGQQFQLRLEPLSRELRSQPRLEPTRLNVDISKQGVISPSLIEAGRQPSQRLLFDLEPIKVIKTGEGFELKGISDLKQPIIGFGERPPSEIDLSKQFRLTEFKEFGRVRFELEKPPLLLEFKPRGFGQRAGEKALSLFEKLPKIKGKRGRSVFESEIVTDFFGRGSIVQPETRLKIPEIKLEPSRRLDVPSIRLFDNLLKIRAFTGIKGLRGSRIRETGTERLTPSLGEQLIPASETKQELSLIPRSIFEEVRITEGRNIFRGERFREVRRTPEFPRTQTSTGFLFRDIQLSPITTPPTPRRLPFETGFPFGGFGRSARRGARIRQPRAFTPTLFSVFTGFRGRPSKIGIRTGFGLRPLPVKKNKRNPQLESVRFFGRF